MFCWVDIETFSAHKQAMGINKCTVISECLWCNSDITLAIILHEHCIITVTIKIKMNG